MTREDIRAHLLTETLSFPQVKDVDWRVDYALSSSILKKSADPTIALQFHLTKPINVSTITGGELFDHSYNPSTRSLTNYDIYSLFFHLLLHMFSITGCIKCFI